MSRVQKTLARIGLVELDEGERTTREEDTLHVDMAAIDRVLQEEALSRRAALAEAPEPDMKAVQKGNTGIMEGLGFEEIYALAQIAPSPYPAEKLRALRAELRL